MKKACCWCVEFKLLTVSSDIYNDNFYSISIFQVWKEDIINTYDIDTKKLAEQCTDFMEKYDNKKAKVYPTRYLPVYVYLYVIMNI